jgi:hypothetical protein
MIYETDTDLTYIWGGSAWQQVSGGTAVGNSGLVYVKGQTIATGVTAQVITGCFSGTYDSYKVVISNVTLSSNGSGTAVYAKMHDGTNPASSGYNYGIPLVDMTIGTVTSTKGISQTTGVVIGTGVGDKFGTSFDVINPNLATHTLFPDLSIMQITNGYSGVGAGMHQNSTAYTSLQIVLSTGTMTGGTIIVYGYRYGTI